MATQTWIGNAAAVAQTTTLTPTSPSIGDIFKVTINSKVISYQTTVGTVADVCNGLATALATTVYPEFKEFTPQNTGTTISLTGNTAGKPFTVQTSVVSSGGATFTNSPATAATGPNFFDNPANWSTGSTPVSGDDVYFNTGNISALYNLAQSSVTLNSLNVYQAYTGTIGLPPYNPVGYREYRPLELQISATTINIGQGSGNGSGRIKFNVGTAACTLNVYNTGQPADQGTPSLIWHGTNASNIVNINKGQVGVAFFPGDTAAVATLRIGYVSNQLGDVQLTCGKGCTLTTITQNGGNVTTNSGATTITINAGTLVVWGSSAVTTLNIDGGTVVYNSTGTLGTAEVAENGVLDFSQDQQAKTVTNPIQRFGDNSQIRDPFKVVGSMVIALEQSSDLSNLDIGQNLTLTRS